MTEAEFHAAIDADLGDAMRGFRRTHPGAAVTADQVRARAAAEWRRDAAAVPPADQLFGWLLGVAGRVDRQHRYLRAAGELFCDPGFRAALAGPCARFRRSVDEVLSEVAERVAGATGPGSRAALPPCDDPDQFRRWCMWHANNALADAARSRRDRRTEGLAGFDPAGTGYGPAEEAEAREAEDRLARCVGGLPEDLRAAVRMSADGHTLTEIAARLKWPLTTAHRRMAAAREALIGCLGRARPRPYAHPLEGARR